MRNRRKSHGGYVLLVVVAVLVLMVTVLGSLSRISLNRALAASDARVRLQQKVGADSIERAVLPHASKVFDRLEEKAEEILKTTGSMPMIPHQVRSAVSIGGVTFDVVLADEDAKLNLNQLYHVTDRQRTESVLNELLPIAASRSIRLIPATKPFGNQIDRPQTSADGASEAEVPRAFRSWGEVFDLQTLRSSIGSDAALPNVTTDISCWGSGALNIRRASDQAISAAASSVLPKAGADRLVSRYRKSPTMTLQILLTQEVKSQADRRRLGTMLGETSTHFSIWMDASARSRRSTRVFSVMRRTDEGVVVNDRFAF